MLYTNTEIKRKTSKGFHRIFEGLTISQVRKALKTVKSLKIIDLSYTAKNNVRASFNCDAHCDIHEIWMQEPTRKVQEEIKKAIEKIRK